ncbi:putative immunity protein [Sporosarcina sp. G11-34]|uniref:putative immunity protein n=1 Tax=Sporosarcina sp. G11-34 TaxID=2849605 RepID=UPI003FA6E476
MCSFCRKCYSLFRTKISARKAGQTWIQREISVSDARKAAFAAHTAAREADNHARAAKQAHVVATRYTHLHTQ